MRPGQVSYSAWLHGLDSALSLQSSLEARLHISTGVTSRTAWDQCCQPPWALRQLHWWQASIWSPPWKPPSHHRLKTPALLGLLREATWTACIHYVIRMDSSFHDEVVFELLPCVQILDTPWMYII